jgi:hypothetical protein
MAADEITIGKKALYVSTAPVAAISDLNLPIRRIHFIDGGTLVATGADGAQVSGVVTSGMVMDLHLREIKVGTTSGRFWVFW